MCLLVYVHAHVHAFEIFLQKIMYILAYQTILEFYTSEDIGKY